MAEYTVATRDEAADWMADYPDFGEMRSFTGALGCGQVAFTWRLMPAGTGGKGSYGHRHRDQEEVYFVIRGKVQFKVGDDEFEAGPQTAVRVSTDAFRSVHNDGPDEVELIICSTKAGGGDAQTEKTDTDFWPAA
jgi:mannose-6-phosphate isomerase-like protein (cupin superfamily)